MNLPEKGGKNGVQMIVSYRPTLALKANFLKIEWRGNENGRENLYRPNL